jgi:hypothetical protein
MTDMIDLTHMTDITDMTDVTDVTYMQRTTLFVHPITGHRKKLFHLDSASPVMTMK